MRNAYWAAGASAAAAYYAGFSPTSQLLGAFPYRGDTAEKTVALTFDDGPNEPFTSQLVDLLDDRAVPATFFQVGTCVKRYPQVSRRIAEAGHVIGNHSYSHRFSSYFTQPRMRTEIARTQHLLHDTIGRTPALFRPPWLGRQPLSLATVRKHGMRPVSGQFAHPLEVMQPGADRIANHAVAITRPGSILIFHDGFDARGGYRGQTVAAVGLVVDALRERGYRFVTVDRLLRVPAYLDAKSPGF